MKYTEVLKTFDSSKDAIECLYKLYDAFLIKFKRKETVELTFTTYGSNKSTRNSNPSLFPSEVYEIRCHFEDSNSNEYEWFKNNVNKI
jgi:hypothetical protein